MNKVDTFCEKLQISLQLFANFKQDFQKGGNVATMCQRKFELLCEMLDFDSPCLSFPQILHSSSIKSKVY